jgi:hypothetical protein
MVPAPTTSRVDFSAALEVTDLRALIEAACGPSGLAGRYCCPFHQAGGDLRRWLAEELGRLGLAGPATAQ